MSATANGSCTTPGDTPPSATTTTHTTHACVHNSPSPTPPRTTRYAVVCNSTDQLANVTAFITKKGWHIDAGNRIERYVPGDYEKDYPMQNRLSKLGAQFVKDRPGKPGGWYFGVGVANAAAAFAKVPGMSTPAKKRPRSMNASPTASAAAADVSKKAKVTGNDGRKGATGKRVVRKAR